MILSLIKDRIKLSKKSVDINPDKISTSETQELINNMTETLSHYALQIGARGISACQVGEYKNIIVIKKFRLLNLYDTYINLKILETHGKQKSVEGCLSLPGILLSVNRPARIKILYYDQNGKIHKKTVWGALASIIDHEHDHTIGKTIIDRYLEEIKEVESER